MTYPFALKKIASFSFLSDEIENLTENEAYDFVLIGTKGASGLKAQFLGSNASKIIEAVQNTPHILIPSAHQFNLNRHIGIASSFKSTEHTIQTIAKVNSIFSQQKRQLTVIHARHHYHKRMLSLIFN